VASPGSGRRALIIVENLPAPFDKRVWQQARTLRDAGYIVSIICPVGGAHVARYELLEDIAIYRHPAPIEADGALGYLLEYANALFWQMLLAWRVFFTRGFDVIQGCNPPDDIFIVAAPFKLLGKRYIFDQHDVAPELFEAKFDRRGLARRVLLILERLSFGMADVAMVTNESYRAVAEGRGGKRPERVFVVRNGPDLERVRLGPPKPELRRGRKYLVGYVGVMGKQEGIDLLLRVVKHIVQARGRSDVQFGLVGGGTELMHMKEYARELGVADFVTFTGRVPDRDLLEMLSTADVCVNPDIANDMNDKSTMIKVMEYMALGKPIVQFDLTEGRYSAQQASLYARKNDEADFAEKLLHLLDHPEERRRMGEFGQQRIAQELEWRRQAPKLLAAYEAALGPYPPAIRGRMKTSAPGGIGRNQSSR
jgi:glycosyltransferase involved in cell wall biosynthesis